MLNNLLEEFGKVPLCNKNPERAFKIGDFVFPLCSRCMMIGIGIIISVILIYYIKEKRKIHFSIKSLLFGAVLIVPTFLDGLFQTFTEYESNNLTRSITGFIAGCGFGLLINIFLQIIQYLIMKFKKQKSLKN